MVAAKRQSTAKPVTEKYNRGRKSLTPSMRAARGRPPLKAKEKPVGMSVPTALPEPPELLDTLARDEWQRVGKYLAAMRRVTQLDVQSLVVYCTSYSTFGEAIRPLLIDRQPLWGFVSGKARPATLAGVALKHAEIVIELAGKFGMTARTRHLDHADTGRPLLPDELHELRGNPSKKKLGRTKTVERLAWTLDDVRPPRWFDRVALDEWNRLVKQFENLDLWTPLDVAVLAVGCATYALIAKCAQRMQDQPLVVPNEESDGSVEHPLSVIYVKHWRVCERVWKEYGLSPVDRIRFPGEVVDKSKPKLSVYGV